MRFRGCRNLGAAGLRQLLGACAQRLDVDPMRRSPRKGIDHVRERVLRLLQQIDDRR